MKPQHKTAAALAVIAIISAALGMRDINKRLERAAVERQQNFEVGDTPRVTPNRESQAAPALSPAQTFVNIQADIAKSEGTDKITKSTALSICNAEFGASLSEVNACYFKRIEEKTE